MWNKDTFDWSLTTPMNITNQTYIQSQFLTWLSGSYSCPPSLKLADA
jgi:hypothetical protein